MATEPEVLVSARSPGVKTVRALLKTARGSHADVEIVYESADERISVKLTRTEAEHIHLKNPERQRLPNRKQATGGGLLTREGEEADRAIAQFAKVAAEVSENPKALEGSSKAAFELARALVIEVREQHGGRERINRISQGLRQQGNFSAANLLDQLAAG